MTDAPIRRYRLEYRVPPLYVDGHESRARTHHYPDGSVYGVPIPRAEWYSSAIVLEAFDETEAWRRLEYRLLKDGYWRDGSPGVPVYERLDAVPQ